MNFLTRLQGSALGRGFHRILKPKKEYPLVDFLVLVYVAFTITFQVFLQISPFVTWLSTTTIYSMQTYLGILGGGLIVLDLFTTKKIWQGKYAWLLYGILAFAALASVRMMSYGLKENIFKLCWAAVQYALVYSCIYRLQDPNLKKWATYLFYGLLAIWTLCCFISLYQFLNQIGYRYVVNPLSADASSNRQGFYDNRLFGIFYTLNHSAYISLLFLIFTFLLTLKRKKGWGKAFLIIAMFGLFTHIVLTYSRSVFISLTLSVLLMTWFFLRRKYPKGAWRKRILAWALSGVVAAGFWFGLQGYRTLLTYAPTGYANLLCFVQTYILNDPGYQFTADIPEYDKNLLEREYLEDDQSNGRLTIYTDYLSLYQDIGAIGLSPGSYMAYVGENYPDLYIVEQTRLEYPDKLESGIIHHTHNGYLLVFVATGFLGMLCLLVFVALCAKKLMPAIAQNKRLPLYFIGAFLAILACAISAVFDEGLFFQNSPYTTLFWFTLGMLLKKCDDFKANPPALQNKND